MTVLSITWVQGTEATSATYYGTPDEMVDIDISDERSNVSLLDEERILSGFEEAPYGGQKGDPRNTSGLPCNDFADQETQPFLNNASPLSDADHDELRLQSSSRSFPSTSTSDVTIKGLGHLPRTKERAQVPSGNVFLATMTVVYAGLTVGNLIKGFLWSVSLTSMHYLGLLSLRIPNEFVRFNPILVILASTICWTVCIVGAICMENMTDLLAQQMLFAVVATSRCAALHWTGQLSYVRGILIEADFCKVCGRRHS